jgi:hypothetical protein
MCGLYCTNSIANLKLQSSHVYFPNHHVAALLGFRRKDLYLIHHGLILEQINHYPITFC